MSTQGHPHQLAPDTFYLPDLVRHFYSLKSRFFNYHASLSSITPERNVFRRSSLSHGSDVHKVRIHWRGGAPREPRRVLFLTSHLGTVLALCVAVGRADGTALDPGGASCCPGGTCPLRATGTGSSDLGLSVCPSGAEASGHAPGP